MVNGVQSFFIPKVQFSCADHISPMTGTAGKTGFKTDGAPAVSPVKAQRMGRKKPVVLLIFDGWGIDDPKQKGNAIASAKPLFYESLIQKYPDIQLQASGAAVGLPDGNAGNSEVGHQTMGAGRILYQDLVKINKAIEDGSFNKNKVFLDAISHAKQSNGTLHLMGLVSDGGVHSHVDHLLALIKLAENEGVKDVNVHAFLDGRDTSPKSAEGYLKKVEAQLKKSGFSPISTVSGRYFAMDRDKRWDRTKQAYEAIVSANSDNKTGSLTALKDSYAGGKTDEFVSPVITDDNYSGIKNGDAALFFNFRPDRARQLTEALSNENFEGFKREKALDNFYLVSMTQYDDDFKTVPVAFPKTPPENTLGDILARHGLTQFRTAETEKYAHVTYFFNGGKEDPNLGEDREMVPSPKVATYDLQPEMNVSQVTKKINDAVNSGQYDFIVANFANPDMVGHTGHHHATEKAIQAVDEQLKIITETVLKQDGILLVTSDHGKAEVMLDENGEPHTAHTTNPVPLILVSNNKKLDLKSDAQYGLGNVAPTILDIMDLPQPKEMTEKSVLDVVA